MIASEKMKEMYNAISELRGAVDVDTPVSEVTFMAGWEAQMHLLPRALPSLISLARAVERMEPEPRRPNDIGWEAEIFAARYEALRALTELEKVLADG